MDDNARLTPRERTAVHKSFFERTEYRRLHRWTPRLRTCGWWQMPKRSRSRHAGLLFELLLLCFKTFVAMKRRAGARERRKVRLRPVPGIERWRP
jgi:hypothetical protein